MTIKKTIHYLAIITTLFFTMLIISACSSNSEAEADDATGSSEELTDNFPTEQLSGYWLHEDGADGTTFLHITFKGEEVGEMVLTTETDNSAYTFKMEETINSTRATAFLINEMTGNENAPWNGSETITFEFLNESSLMVLNGTNATVFSQSNEEAFTNYFEEQPPLFSLEDLDGYWLEDEESDYLSFQLTGDKEGEVHFHNGEEDSIYSFVLHEMNDTAIQLHLIDNYLYQVDPELMLDVVIHSNDTISVTLYGYESTYQKSTFEAYEAFYAARHAAPPEPVAETNNDFSFWSGDYRSEMSGNHAGTMLTLSNFQGDKFDFHLMHFHSYWIDDEDGGGWNGYDEDNLNGTASIINDKGQYSNGSCGITFEFIGDSINLIMNNCTDKFEYDIVERFIPIY
ncbi:hypothetical protein [Evansella tamaricis]|uniref:Uncharacterized protein n=1 Tax=Evansella tamaricis TaxID=2069301 RepID=A0ABS6JE74_9BACI|nr:hypothetical protein [Evansella tamaricis]MBU9711973.1 hypothetical protein [Evansella tamaricis]